MQIINIDKDPFLSSVKSNSDGHIFAGHVTHIVGKNFPGTEKEALENGITPEYYDNKEKIISAKNLDKLKTIWINTDQNDYRKFSIKISSKDVMTKFLDSYSDFVGANNFFVVCDDRVLQSYNKESDYKKFFPVDSEDQLENDFKIWRL